MSHFKTGKLAAASLTLLILFLGLGLLGLGSIPSLAQAGVPGLHFPDRSIGVCTWTGNYLGNPYTSLLNDAWVVDHEMPITPNGDSHIVTVTYPGHDFSTYRLFPTSQCAPDGCYYMYFDSNIDQNNLPAYSGDYTFRVERANDPASFSEVVDHLQVAPVGMLDESSFAPKHPTTQAITAFFDDVYVNGMLYDDFSGGLNHDRWYWDDRWMTGESGQARFDVDFNPGRGSYWMTFNDQYINPGDVKQIQATVRVTNMTGDQPQVRVGGTVVRDHIGEIHAQVRIQGNQATYQIGPEQPGGNHYRSFDYVPNQVLGPVTTGNRYELSLAYDEGSQTYTFSVKGLNDSVNYSASHTLSGLVAPSTRPYSGISVAGWVWTSTTPEFDWDPVRDANHYIVRIYGLNDATLWRGYTKEPPYRLPPGILKPSSIYKYRIEAMGNHQWFEWDNAAISDRNLTRFSTLAEEAQAPYVNLHSIGAETWRGTLGDNVSFYIKVHDAQGVPENIASVTVQLPDGGKLDLHLDRNEGPNRGVYRGSYFGSPLPAGDYVFTATDRDNNTHSATNYLDPNPIDPPALVSLEPPDNALVGDTAVTFDWDSVPGAAFYEVNLYDQDLKDLFTLRTTELNASLPAGVLKEGAYYRYRIYSRRGFFEDFANDGASSPPGSVFDSQAFFTTANTGGSSTPTIDIGTFGVAIWKAPHPNGIDTIYNLELSAQVSDGDGVPDGIREVVVVFPDGTTTMPLKYINSPTWGYNYHDDVTLTGTDAIQAGQYTFTVTDFDGNIAGPVIDTLTADDIAAAMNFDWATIIHPADGATLDTTTPTIAWTPPAGAAYCRVRVQNAWGSDEVFFSEPIPVSTTALTLGPGILQTNRNYSIRVYSFREAIGANVQVYSEPATVSQDRVHISIPGTVTGTNIEVRPLDQNTGAAVATLTFDEVTGAGTTTVASTSEWVPPPSGFALGTPPTYYEITTTATFAGNIEVCLDYSGVYFENPDEMELYHYTGDQWVNITTSHDLTEKIICGQVDSLSPFAILEPKYCKGDLDGDGDVDGRDLRAFAVSLLTGGTTGDLNGDGVVNHSDLIILLNNFGKDDCAATPAH